MSNYPISFSWNWNNSSWNPIYHHPYPYPYAHPNGAPPHYHAPHPHHHHPPPPYVMATPLPVPINVNINHARTDIYVDGSCYRNGQEGARAGYGVYWADNHPNNKSGRVEGKQESNRSELQAAREALRDAHDQDYNHLRILSDSEWFVNSVNNCRKTWKDNSWCSAPGVPVKHVDLWLHIDYYASRLDVVFEHVPGHSGIHGNEMADMFAKQGVDRQDLAGRGDCNCGYCDDCCGDSDDDYYSDDDEDYNDEDYDGYNERY